MRARKADVQDRIDIPTDGHSSITGPRLAGKTIVVTGGSSGIGRAMALAFADHGAGVIVADLRQEPREGGQSTAELIRDRGGTARFVVADVSRWGDIDALVDYAVDSSGRLDVFVNNAIIAGR